MEKYSIADLEKAIKYAKSQNAVVVTISTQALGRDRLLFKVEESYKGSSVIITIFCAESAKMPEITKTETLF